jgi:hypothetical protein
VEFLEPDENNVIGQKCKTFISGGSLDSFTESIMVLYKPLLFCLNFIAIDETHCLYSSAWYSDPAIRVSQGYQWLSAYAGAEYIYRQQCLRDKLYL